MRGAEDDINHLGELRQNQRQGLEHVLDTLVRRKQAEREQNQPPFHPELVLEISRIDEAYIRNTMRDEIDLRRRRLVYLLQHLSAADIPGAAGEDRSHPAWY